MSRQCPVCPSQPLTSVPSGEIHIDVCPRCQGMWFDRGELELFPDRPSSRLFLASARSAPARCRKQGHSVPRANAECPTCRSAPVSCPNCGARLGLVPTPKCVIDVCIHCEGVWLDAGEFELLEGHNQPQGQTGPTVSSASTEWEIPKPTDLGEPDPWLTVGHRQALGHTRGSVDHQRPFSCRQCAKAIGVAQAFVLDGDVYCESCRPPTAVHAGEDPFAFVDSVGRVARRVLVALGRTVSRKRIF